MYITISQQQIKGNYAQSATDFVNYLEKENAERPLDQQEHFFNQYGEEITAGEVIKDIDGNTAKLKKKEPKFFSITLNPSRRELGQISDSPKALKRYTQEVMKEYARCFNREIDGRPVRVEDIKYYAKVERHRTFKGTDKEIQENQPYATRILELKQEIKRIEAEGDFGNITKLKQQMQLLEGQAPHQLDGQRIVRGMQKPGPQSHIHIIVSRIDASNRYSLSPGSKYKASNVEMNGKLVKRGFNRDRFYDQAEKQFDRMFGYSRNYVETYKARKTLAKDPKLYFTTLMGLPAHEKAIAFTLLNKAGIQLPILPIPTNQVQLTIRAIKKIKRGINRAIESGSIGI